MDVSLQFILGSGHIDFNEFLVMMSQTKEKGHQAELRQAFRLFDSDGDGFITFDDLKRVMRNCEESLSETELKDMFTKADINRDNLVDMKGKLITLEFCFENPAQFRATRAWQELYKRACFSPNLVVTRKSNWYYRFFSLSLFLFLLQSLRGLSATIRRTSIQKLWTAVNNLWQFFLTICFAQIDVYRSSKCMHTVLFVISICKLDKWELTRSVCLERKCCKLNNKIFTLCFFLCGLSLKYAIQRSFVLNRCHDWQISKESL